MPVEVVDASAVAVLLFGEPEAAAVAERLRGCDLAAPTLLPYEIASVCLKKLKRHLEQEEALLAVWIVRTDEHRAARCAGCGNHRTGPADGAQRL